jgi:hypothetical protein
MIRGSGQFGLGHVSAGLLLSGLFGAAAAAWFTPLLLLTLPTRGICMPTGRLSGIAPDWGGLILCSLLTGCRGCGRTGGFTRGMLIKSFSVSFSSCGSSEYSMYQDYAASHCSILQSVLVDMNPRGLE